MLSPEPASFQQSLADFCALPKAYLAGAPDWVSIRHATGYAHRVPPFAHQDHTPSPDGQRADTLALLPDFSGGRGMDPVGWYIGWYDRTKNAAKREPGQTGRAWQAHKSSEGTGICLFETLFLVWPPALALRPAATLWANRPLAAVPLALVPLRSPAAAFCKARPSVRRATSPIASLIPANVADTDPKQIDAEQLPRLSVPSVTEFSKGETKCPHRKSFSHLWPAQALGLAAIRWVNRPSAVPRSARALLLSLEAASQQVPQWAQAQMCLLARQNLWTATDLTQTGTARRSSRDDIIDKLTPLGFAPMRGFRVSLKTQKDSPCSRKS